MFHPGLTTFLCWFYSPIRLPPPSLKVISSNLAVAQWGGGGADGQPERERKGGRQETLRNYWAGETPWCQKFTCKKKLPASPAFLICIHSVSPLVLSLPASCLLASSFSLSPSLTIFLPPPLCPSVSLIILHCSTCTVVQHWQSELCTHTRMRTSAHSHTHAQTRAHTGRHTPTTSGAPPLLLSHLSTADTKHATTPGVQELHQKTLVALHQNCILLTRNVAYCLYLRHICVIKNSEIIK